MLIAQLSDLHLLPDGAPWRGFLDTAGMARQAIRRLAELSPRPDLVVLSGDLADRGNEACYRLLRTMLDELPMPYALLPGNHDDGDALRAVFPEQAFAGDPMCCQRLEAPAGDLLLLDTTVAGRSHGHFGLAQLRWLEGAIRQNRASLLFLHHPPFATGIGGMDGIALHGADELAAWLARNSSVRGLFCGHVHRPVFTQWAGRPVAIAPSSAHQIALDLDGPQTALRYALEPPGLLLIRWLGDSPVVHVMPIASATTQNYD